MKKSISLLLVLAMLLSFAACAQNQTTTPPATTPPTSLPAASTPTMSTAAPTEVTEPVSHYPVTVTDHAGRCVEIASEPQRLVSGYYISSSALIAMNLDSRLVGIEAKANKRAIYALSAPALMNLPSVGTAKASDLEGCLALEPDLVILPLKLKDAAKALEEMGIAVLLVNPENQESLNDMIRLIGVAANAEAEATALLDYLSRQEALLTQRLNGCNTPSVYLAGNSSLLSTAGNAMYQSALIHLAGGQNVAAEISDTYWVDVSYEQLLTWNPEYILLASDATYSVEDVLADPNLAGCDAVVNGKVFQLPSKAEAWDSPVPSGILGALWLASVLHPDLLSVADCSVIVDEYYETFYQFTYSEK